MVTGFSRMNADVIIVGSGVAGALIANRLAMKGVKVVVVDAGKRTERQQLVNTFRSSAANHPSAIYPESDVAEYPRSYLTDESIIESGPDPFNATYLKVVGGTTWHWAATTPRFVPEEFQLFSLHGVGRDWPMSYRVLKRFYAEAENELGVSGAIQELPGHLPSYMEQVLAERLARHGVHTRIRPVARNTRPYAGRPQCNGNHNCTPICPTGAQYSAYEHIKKAEKRGAAIMEEHAAVFLQLGQDKEIHSVTCKRPDGSEVILSARYFVLAANPIETPRLMLLSAQENAVTGIANRSDAVGRFLMNHHIVGANYILPYPVYSGRGHFGCLLIDQYRAYDSQRKLPGMVFQSNNHINPVNMVNSLVEGRHMAGAELDQSIRDQFRHTATLNGFIEELPQWQNRVSLHESSQDKAGTFKPVISFKRSEQVNQGIRLAVKRLKDFGGYLDAESITVHNPDYRTSSHMAGTTIMGSDHRTSVVDQDCRSHDHKNLYVAGSSVFPSIGTINPTLTIAALSLRIAETIEQELV